MSGSVEAEPVGDGVSGVSCGRRLLTFTATIPLAVLGIAVALAGLETRHTRVNRPLAGCCDVASAATVSLGLAIFWASVALWSLFGLRGFYNAVRSKEVKIWRHPGQVLFTTIGLFASYRCVVELIRAIST